MYRPVVSKKVVSDVKPTAIRGFIKVLMKSLVQKEASVLMDSEPF